MKFRVIYQQTSNNAQSPVRVVEQTTGREVGWINRYLDREYVRRLAPGTPAPLCSQPAALSSAGGTAVHHTDAVAARDLTESTLLDYVRFQSSTRTSPCRLHNQ